MLQMKKLPGGQAACVLVYREEEAVLFFSWASGVDCRHTRPVKVPDQDDWRSWDRSSPALERYGSRSLSSLDSSALLAIVVDGSVVLLLLRAGQNSEEFGKCDPFFPSLDLSTFMPLTSCQYSVCTVYVIRTLYRCNPLAIEDATTAPYATVIGITPFPPVRERTDVRACTVYGGCTVRNCRSPRFGHAIPQSSYRRLGQRV